ncbi:MAG: UDP-N-acetylmuramate:L-alanyl-gamma-D-glutamyl-meso-diaminopimelate ligase [Gammaproteobacteria bacterium]
MKIYILGVCGTFMAGIALLARELGFEVEGSDAQVYPPMSTQLSEAGILLHEGYQAESLPEDIDVFIIGNAITRGNAQFEQILNQNLRYISGPQWLYEQVLRDRWVLAVAGTHGKTTGSSMLAWILHHSGIDAGYLIGGVSRDFSRSAHLGEAPFFVIEADEYDTALFDKRSKFIHYHPRTLVLNNLEFDHADIFEDLAAIKRQFHHLVRTLPGNALVIHNDDDVALEDVLAQGCWSERLSFATENDDADFLLDENFDLCQRKTGKTCHLDLSQPGLFNAMNACAAALAARHAGIPLQKSVEALRQFSGVKRRQEMIAEIDGVCIIDDFAHHPTAIELTLQALRPGTSGRLYAVIELRSNTMKMGVHANRFEQSLTGADVVLMCYNKDLEWDIKAMAKKAFTRVLIKKDVEQIIKLLVRDCRKGDQVVIMSNGGFDNIQQRLIHAMQSRI